MAYRAQFEVYDDADWSEAIQVVDSDTNQPFTDTDDAVFESPRGPDRWGRRFVGKEAVRQAFAAPADGEQTD